MHLNATLGMIIWEATILLGTAAVREAVLDSNGTISVHILEHETDTASIYRLLRRRRRIRRILSGGFRTAAVRL